MPKPAERVTLDFTNYKDRSGSHVPPGRYRVTIEDIETGKSRTQHTMFTVFLRIVGGDHDGATIVDRLTVTDKALFRLAGFLNALGIKTPRKRLAVVPQQFVGHTLEVDLDDGEVYMGRIKSEVRGYMTPEKKGKAPADLEDNEADEYEEEVSEDIETPEAEEEAPALKTKAKAKAKKKAEPEPEPEPEPDDEDDEDDDDDDVDLDEVDLR